MPKKAFSFAIYYIVMLAVLLSWTNPTSPPSAMSRILFLVALMVPLLANKRYYIYIPAVIIFFHTVSYYGSAFSYMPTDISYIAIFPLIALISIKNKTMPPAIWIVFFLYISFVNLLCGGNFSNSSKLFLILILLYSILFLDKNYTYTILSWCFILSSIILAILFIINRDKFSYAYGGDLERSMWMDPNYWGIAVGVGTVISFVEYTFNEKAPKLFKILLLITMGLTITVLILNASRGALLAVSVSCLYIILTNKSSSFKTKVFILLLITIFIFYLFSQGYFELLEYRMENRDLLEGNGRTEIWTRKINAYLMLHPVKQIFGIGNVAGMNLGFSYLRGFHNDFIGILVCYGIVGLIMYISILLDLYICSSNKKVAMAILLYIMVTGFTVEPISGGHLIIGSLILYSYCATKEKTIDKLKLNRNEYI